MEQARTIAELPFFASSQVARSSRVYVRTCVYEPIASEARVPTCAESMKQEAARAAARRQEEHAGYAPGENEHQTNSGHTWQQGEMSSTATPPLPKETCQIIDEDATPSLVRRLLGLLLSRLIQARKALRPDPTLIWSSTSSSSHVRRTDAAAASRRRWQSAGRPTKSLALPCPASSS